jgi:hypothetical protein
MTAATVSSAAAERARRARDRRRRGSVVVSIELTAPTLAHLIGLDLLPEAARADRTAVRAAFLNFCRQALDRAATEE